MRYTEEKYESKQQDLLGAIVAFLVGLIMAPYRIINEVSTKVTYMGKEAVEKLSLCTIVLITITVLWDFVGFIITGKIHLVDGNVPLLSKVVALLISVWVSFYFSKRLTYYEEEYIEPEVVEEEYEEAAAVSVGVEDDVAATPQPMDIAISDLIARQNTSPKVDRFSQQEIDLSSPIIPDEEDLYQPEIVPDYDSGSGDNGLDLGGIMGPVGSNSRGDFLGLEEITPAALLANIKAGESGFRSDIESGLDFKLDGIDISDLLK